MAAEPDRQSHAENADSVSEQGPQEMGADQTAGRRSLRQRIRSGATWLVLGRICSMGALLGAHGLLTRLLSEADYAAYAIASVSAILLATVVVFGTPKMLIRSLKLQLPGGNTRGARLTILSCFATIALVASVALVTFLLGSDYFFDLPRWRGIRDYSLLVACWGCLSAFCLVSSRALESLDDFRSAALVGARNGGVLTNLLFLVLTIVAHQFGVLSLASVLGLQVALNLLSLALAAYYIRRGLRNYAQRTPTVASLQQETVTDVPHHNVRWFLKESWPNFIVQMTTMTINELQIIVLGFLATERSIADYNVVLRLLGVINSFQTLATTVIAPFVAELLAVGKTLRLERILRGASTLVALPTLALTGTLMLFPEFVLKWGFGENFVGAAWALRLASVGCTLHILSGSNSLVMVMSGNQRQLMVYSVAASFFYLAIAIPMIQRWNIVGAALAVSLVFGTYNILVTLLVKSKVGVWTIPTLGPRQIVASVGTLLGRDRTG